jgi:hypothetical protein
LHLDLKTADLDRCKPGVARCGLRLLRAALPSYQPLFWQELAACLVEAARMGATVTELKQMGYYAKEVADAEPTRADEAALAAAHAKVVEYYPVEDIEEVVMGGWKRMLLEEGREAGREEGREEGLEKGREEGETIGIQKGVVMGQVLGLREGVLFGLESRFGPLPAWVQDRMANPTLDQLKVWMARGRTADTLTEVFADE